MSSIELGSNEFALKLHQSLSSNDQNLVLSPFSLTTVLAITLYGSTSNSGEQLSSVLFGKTISVNEYQSMVQQFKALIDECVKSNSNVFTSANFLYIQKQFSVLRDFSETIEKYFYAKSKQLDFLNSNAEAVESINADINSATNGKIKSLFGSIDANTKLVLANALYFKGLWELQFKNINTKVMKFTTGTNTQVDVDMMFQNKKFPFGHSDHLQCKAIELGYNNSNIVMIVLLPNEDNSLKQLESNLNVQTLNDLLKSLYLREVDLYLPKFKLESTLKLIPILQKMGIKDIFDEQLANFSGITNDWSRLFVSNIIQKAVIEVNEEGTEAAAATGLTIGFCSLPPPPEMFKANRPFMFLLMNKHNNENSKNLILFSGTVNNPKI